MVSKRAVVAQTASPPKGYQPLTFPAPTAGWVTSDSLVGSRPLSAQTLENFFPTQKAIRTRGGQLPWGNIATVPYSMMVYNVDNQAKFFVGSETTIFDISLAGTQTAAVTGQTGGYYSYVNFSTSGGYFLVAVNGKDPMQIFDGTDWFQVTDSSTPYSVTGIDTSKFLHVGVYQNRLFFVESGSLNIWYLAVNSIAGAAETFNLAGVYEKGGAVLYTATWSLDAGDGLDAKLVVLSTEGETAVYQGTNPSDANDWSIVGVYNLTRPMGPKCNMRAGGDLIIGTAEGMVPISVAVSKDPAALSLASISAVIEPDWLQESENRQSLPWEIAKWSRRNMAVVSLPTDSEDELDLYCFVVNLQTGAWCKYTGWDTRCMEIFQDQLYIATRDGRILQVDVGGDDDGTSFSPVVVLNWSDFGIPGNLKNFMQARAKFRTASAIIPDISMSTDYVVSLPTKPNAPIVNSTPSLWDVGKWDEAIWDDGTVMTVYSTGWVSIGLSGEAGAPQIQMTCSGNLPPTAELIEIAVTYELSQGLVN